MCRCIFLPSRLVGTAATNYRFSGEQLDPESSLYFLRARYYDPVLGRFISRDPISGKLDNPQTQNPYAYALDNPVNVSDPSGLWAGGLCGNGNLGVAAFGTCSVCVVLTKEREIGVAINLGGGGSTGLATGIGPQGLYSTANNLNEMEGVDIFAGGSAWAWGGDSSFSGKDTSIQTYTAGPSVGPDLTPPFLPVEFHGGATKTWTFPLITF